MSWLPVGRILGVAWWGPALAFVVAMCALPGPVVAGCSKVEHAPLTPASGLRLLHLAGALATRSAEPAPLREGKPLECSGPACSGKSGLPAPPSVVVLPAVSHWAMVEPRSDSRVDARFPLSACDDAPSGPSPFCPTVFHPPKLG